MNNRKKNAVLVLTGALVGTMLTSPAVHAAEEYFKAYPAVTPFISTDSRSNSKPMPSTETIT